MRPEHNEETLDVLDARGFLLVNPRPVKEEDVALLEDLDFGFAASSHDVLKTTHGGSRSWPAAQKARPGKASGLKAGDRGACLVGRKHRSSWLPPAISHLRFALQPGSENRLDSQPEQTFPCHP